MQVLVDHGSNVNAREASGIAPLHAVAVEGYLEIARLLLERGADVHALSEEGKTPYQPPLIYGCRAVADLFREHNAGEARSERNLLKLKYDI